MLRKKLLIIAILPGILFLISCSPYKQFIRVDTQLKEIRNTIDTIAVFSDALVAVDAKNDYYSEKGSYILDSLIYIGVNSALKRRGYATKQIKPVFSGSFMDSFLTVPVKKFDSDQIELMKLPSTFHHEFSQEQSRALQRMSRRLYLHTIYNNNGLPSINITNPVIKSDIDTLREIAQADHILFIFNQSLLVNPAVTAAMVIGSLALTTILSGGALIGYMTKVSTYNTYMILLQLSTGQILWTNYSPYQAAPVAPLFEISRSNGDKPLSNYMKSDSLKRLVLSNWRLANLKNFPDKNSSRIFPGYKFKTRYPSVTFFKRETVIPSLDNTVLKNRIDSTISILSLSEDTILHTPLDSIEYPQGNGKSAPYLKEKITIMAKYLQYAYSSRLRFRPDLEGTVAIRFLITPEGEAKNVAITESTLDDPILEYEFNKIIRSAFYGRTNKWNGNTLIVRRLKFELAK